MNHNSEIVKFNDFNYEFNDENFKQELNQLSDLSDTFSEIGNLAKSFNNVAGNLDNRIDELFDGIKNALPVIKPVAIAGGTLLVGYLLTGLINNIIDISSKTKK